MSKLIMTSMDVKKVPCVVTALREDNRICQIQLEKKRDTSLLGNIYIGKVKNVSPNMDAAFIEIAPGQMCYYSITPKNPPVFTNEKKDNKIKAGDEMLVQVCREAIKMKLPCVTCNLNFTGAYLIVTSGRKELGFSSKLSSDKKKEIKEWLEPLLPTDAGVIVRTNCGDASPEKVKQELEKLYTRYCHLKETAKYRTVFSVLEKAQPVWVNALKDVYQQKLEEIVTDDKEIFEAFTTDNEENALPVRFYEDKLLPLKNLYGIEQVIKSSREKKVWLKSGGFLIIEQTEAFVSVDVNTGKCIDKKKQRELFLKINLEAAKEIAFQMRLRNLSGIILVDFINMDEQEDNALLMSRFQSFLNHDPVKAHVVDMTKLKIVEVTRKKIRKSLAEELAGLEEPHD